MNARFELAAAFELHINFDLANVDQSKVVSIDRFHNISDDDLEYEIALLKLAVCE